MYGYIKSQLYMSCQEKFIADYNSDYNSGSNGSNNKTAEPSFSSAA
jgi:hypothetical protein